jgi:hypothetical protein
MVDTRRRAVVAVLFGVFGAAVGIAGVGHAYLRRWRRAAAWFAFVVGAAMVLVYTFDDPATATPSTLPREVVVPVLALLVTSVLDAYVVARRSGSSEGPTCPHCGRPIDTEIDFCQWCTEPLPDEHGGNVEQGHDADATDGARLH